MIKIENIITPSANQRLAIINGTRNPMNSWDRTDSYCESETEFVMGENDFNLLKKLAKAGTSHSKYRRMIVVYADITAPLYWWKEFDTYKVGTVANSCSTMHCLLKNPFKISNFSFENLIGNNKQEEYFDVNEKFNEEFKPIKEHENYFISNKGRIYNKIRGKFLSPSVNSSNYKKVVLNGKNLYVHRLVAEAFCFNPNNLCEVNHKDGNKWNNNYTNLEWVSKSENAQHAFNMGLREISGYTKYKVSCSAHRFTTTEINDIRQMYYDGMTKQEIANKIGCYSSIICNILNNKTYREIEMTPYDTAKLLVDNLNELREKYLEIKANTTIEDKNRTSLMKQVWWQMIQLLPCSYNQKRTVMLNYEVLANMYRDRKNHKLTEWVEFCKEIEKLPYSELIIGEKE